MAVHRFLDITLAVPDPDALAAFWERRGMRRAGAVLGTADRPRQLTLVEGPYRHLAELHLGCESEADLGAIAASARQPSASTQASPARPSRAPTRSSTTGWSSTSSATEPLTEAAARSINRPGRTDRTTARADVVEEAAPRPPRRVGHVVLGTPHLAEACAFYVDGLGFRVSDKILDGVLTFTACRARPPQPADPARAGLVPQPLRAGDGRRRRDRRGRIRGPRRAARRARGRRRPAPARIQPVLVPHRPGRARCSSSSPTWTGSPTTTRGTGTTAATTGRRTKPGCRSGVRPSRPRSSSPRPTSPPSAPRASPSGGDDRGSGHPWSHRDRDGVEPGTRSCVRGVVGAGGRHGDDQRTRRGDAHPGGARDARTVTESR